MITHAVIREKRKPVRLTERDEAVEQRRAEVFAHLLIVAESRSEREEILATILTTPGEVQQ